MRVIELARARPGFLFVNILKKLDSSKLMFFLECSCIITSCRSHLENTVNKYLIDK